MWSETSRQLVSLREQQLILWECPWAFNIAPKLLESCRHIFPVAAVGPAGAIEYFTGPLVTLKLTNGSMYTQAVPPYSEKIEKAVDVGQWDAALKIARLFDVSRLCGILCVRSFRSRYYYYCYEKLIIAHGGVDGIVRKFQLVFISHV